VILGSLILAPPPATAIGATVGPTVIDPETPAIAIGATVGPTVILGSLTLTPSSVVANGVIVDPTVILGAITNIPNPVSAVGRTVFDVAPPLETIFLSLELSPDVFLGLELL